MALITSVSEANTLLRRAEEEKKKAKSGSAESFRNVLGGKLQAVSEDMDAIFEEAASRFGLSSKLLKAVAKAESNFNPKAVSRAGAMGVMQLMPGTAKSLGVSDPYDARQNIMGGAKYLKENLDKFGDVRLALAAYNAGPGSVTKYGGVPPYAETQNYVKKIMGYLGGDTLYANKTVSTGQGTAGSGQSTAAMAARLYAMNSLGSASSLGSLSSTDSSSGSLRSSSGLSGSTSSLYGLGGLSSLSGLYGSGFSGSLLSGLAMSEDGDTVTMDKESYANLIEILRLQMMMNASREVGSLSF